MPDDRSTVIPGSRDFSFEFYQASSAVAHVFHELRALISNVLIIGRDLPLPDSIAPDVELEQARIDLQSFEADPQSMLDYNDGEFSCVVVFDAIDLLTESARRALLTECARVTRSVLVVLSPFDSPLTRNAEESLDEVCRTSTGSTDEVVSAHREVGLPDMNSMLLFLGKLFRYDPEVLPVGSLRSWTLFRMLEHVARPFDRGQIFYSRLNAYYNSKLASVDHGNPSYRHCVVFSRDKVPVKQLRSLRKHFTDNTHEPEIQVMRDFLRMTLDSIADALAVKPPDGVLRQSQTKIEELERKIRLQQRQIEKLTSELTTAKTSGNSSSRGGLLKKLFTF